MTISITIPAGAAAEFLIAEAVRRDCSPNQLGLALISCIAASNLSEAVLDGTSPAAFAMPKSGRPMTVSKLVIRAMAEFEAANGSIRATSTQIAKKIGTRNRGSIVRARKTLRLMGLIETIEATGGRGVPGKYRITDKGREFLEGQA